MFIFMRSLIKYLVLLDKPITFVTDEVLYYEIILIILLFYTYSKALNTTPQ